MAQWMDRSLFKELGNVPQAQKGWTCVANVVAEQLMGSDVFPVAHIQDGSYYELGGVILKEALSKKDKVLMRVPGAIHVGHLKGFIQPTAQGQENEAALAKLQNTYEDKECQLNQNYIFLEETMRKGVKKTIRVEIQGCKKRSLVSLPGENSISVSFASKGYEYLTKFFLLSTVYFADNVKVEVRISDQKDEYTVSTKDWPIGFKLHRFIFNTLGVIGLPKEVIPKNWKVHFLAKSRFRGPMDRLPDIPTDQKEVQDHSEDANGYITLPGQSKEARSR